MDNIVALFDGSQHSKIAVQAAFALVKLKLMESVKVVSCQRRNKPFTAYSYMQVTLRQQIQSIKNKYAQVKSHEDWKIVSDTHQQVLKYCQRYPKDLVVLGQYGRKGPKIRSGILSTMVTSLLFYSNMNLLLVRHPFDAQSKRIVFCFDGTQMSFQNLKVLKKFQSCHLVVVYCPPRGSQLFVNTLKKKLSLNPTFDQLRPLLVVLQQSENQEGLLEWLQKQKTWLVIVGSRGDYRKEGLGRTAQSIFTNSSKNILLLK